MTTAPEQKQNIYPIEPYTTVPGDYRYQISVYIEGSEDIMSV